MTMRMHTRIVRIPILSMGGMMGRGIAAALTAIVFTLAGTAKAQTGFMCTWELVSSGAAAATESVRADSQTLRGMQAQYVNAVQRTSPVGTAGTWPAETAENASRYIQYSIGPETGFVMTVASASMYVFASGGSNMKASVYYSTDSLFSSRTQIGITVNCAQSKPAAPNVSSTPGVVLHGGEKLYIRIYPWYTTSATGKYVIPNSVAISGTIASEVMIIPSTAALGDCIQTSDTPGTARQYALAGTHLTGSVVVSIPKPFEISPDAGGSWKSGDSALILPVDGGHCIGEPVAVTVRLNASVPGEYSGRIRHASPGAPDTGITVQGIRYPAAPSTASSLAVDSIGGSSVILSMGGGAGTGRIVVLCAGGPPGWKPADGSIPAGVDANAANALQQPGGGRIVYDGSGKRIEVVGLEYGTVYEAAVFEYNSAGGRARRYLTASPGRAGWTTAVIPVLVPTRTSLVFGDVAADFGSALLSFSIAGRFLSTASPLLSFDAPEGFSVSFDSAGTYAAHQVCKVPAETLPPVRVFVRFAPAECREYSGILTIAGGGADTLRIQVSGTGVRELIQTSHPVGFASAGPGTTGGEGGTTVIITDPQQLADLLKARENKSTAPVIVYISGMLTGYSTEISVKRTSNVSILGVGSSAGFQGFGMKIVECSNIVVRNLSFADCRVDEKDGLSVDGSSNVWIDHCVFTDSPADDPSGKSHDGELDVKNGSFNITFSYNHFLNHRKTCLFGHSESQTSDTVMKVTYYRNWFDGTYSRHPRIRFGKAHILGNLYTGVGIVGADSGGYGIGVTCQAHVLVENNYFENTPVPVLISTINDPGETLSGDPAGYCRAVGNGMENSGVIVQNLSGFMFDPLAYYSYAAGDAQAVREIVRANAGTGKLPKLANVSYDRGNSPMGLTLEQNWPNPFNPATTIAFSVAQTGPARVSVYDILGRKVAVLFEGRAEAGVVYRLHFSGENFGSGAYFCVLEAAFLKAVRRMMLEK